jgi:hypothetical protein
VAEVAGGLRPPGCQGAVIDAKDGGALAEAGIWNLVTPDIVVSCDIIGPYIVVSYDIEFKTTIS